MSRALRFVPGILVAGGIVILLVHAPRALARIDLFQVRDVELEGARYLTPEDAYAAAGIPDSASVFDPHSEWEAALERHPLVKEVRVRRKLPGTLVFRVEEREPVGLVPNPVLEPVDREGRRLPVDPATHRLDLPLLLVSGGGTGAPPEVRAERIRLLAGEASRLAQLDPELARATSELASSGEDVVVRLSDPEVALWYRPPLEPHRLRQALAALRHAGSHFEGVEVAALDLRYEDQVVVRTRAGRGP